MEYVGPILGGINLIVLAIAAFVGLKIGPVERRIGTIEKDLANYDRWRGMVTERLDTHTKLLEEIRDKLK